MELTVGKMGGVTGGGVGRSGDGLTAGKAGMAENDGDGDSLPVGTVETAGMVDDDVGREGLPAGTAGVAGVEEGNEERAWGKGFDAGAETGYLHVYGGAGLAEDGADHVGGEAGGEVAEQPPVLVLEAGDGADGVQQFRGCDGEGFLQFPLEDGVVTHVSELLAELVQQRRVVPVGDIAAAKLFV